MTNSNMKSYIPVCILLVIFLYIALFITSNYWLNLLSHAVIYSILALSLQLIFGYTGQVSLAHAAFFGIGAYTSAILTLHFQWPFLFAFLVAGIAAAVLSVVLTPMSKLNEIYFSVSTLAFNLIVVILFANGGQLTGGWNGLTNIPYPNLFGWELDSKKEFFIFSSIILFLLYVAMTRLVNGRLGRDFRAIRDNKLAAASVGIDLVKSKTKGFILGCFCAGIAGSLMVHMSAFISPEPFNFKESINILLMVVLGGLGSFPGAILGGFGVTFLNELLQEVSLYRPILYGLIIIVMMIFFPTGLYGLLKKVPFFYRKSAQIHDQKSPGLFIKEYLSVPEATEQTILKVRGISKNFDGVKALDHVSMSVNKGDIFALIGPNGAGKTTLINIITGLEKATKGSIIFNGKSMNRLALSKTSSHGMVRTFQTTKLFNSMTVLENVVSGTSTRIKNDIWLPLLKNKKFRDEESYVYALANQIIKVVGLEGKEDELCSNLSYGHRRLVEIARSLAVRPYLLLLDEPAAGLNLSERTVLMNLILSLRDNFGITIFIVEHDLNFLSQLADHMAVLNFGKKISEGEPNDVINDSLVIEAYLGRRGKKNA